jgi:hypothetical protein
MLLPVALEAGLLRPIQVDNRTGSARRNHRVDEIAVLAADVAFPAVE